MSTFDLNVQELNSYGRKGKRGNILGIEPYMLPEDYASAKNFQQKLEGYLLMARQQGWINRRTIVLWPEYIGTFLMVSGEKPATTIEGVVENIRKAHRKEFDAFLASAPEQYKEYAAMLRTKAGAMATSYQVVFSRLSRKYKATTVAGSIALPSPQLIKGRLVLDVNGPIYNVSVVFDARGDLYREIVYKAYPTASELLFTTSAPAGILPAFDTPAGRLGVLICADSWYPAAYARLKALGVDMIAVPSFGHGGLKAWTETWKGYDGWPNPPDVKRKDINRITNSKAWLKYSLIGRINESKARHGVNIFLHGDLWTGLNAGGGVAAVVGGHDAWHREDKTEYATLNNLWL